ncbi:MAG: histidinol dehydrogenase [Candidatus Altiarchaeales archaeon]|nr:MAG: histidinol dehydrogenase [Candidatus Altiarchaeales archaeon]
MKVIRYSEGDKIKELLERKTLNLNEVLALVRGILENVEERGDSALINYSKKFDNFDLTKENIRVSNEEIKKAHSRVNEKLLKALKHAHRNITRFHEGQMRRIGEEWDIEIEKGVIVGERVTPIENIGAYIPGGRTSYPSTVLMTCIPARVAGVKRVAITSPPPISDAILVAADICGVDEIYRVGGAQAIAALTYGTESIPRVDKIVGPGNVYVMTAKMQVYGRVDIDMPAGPSEVLILADKTANSRFIAADLLAQAEHDPSARCLVVTDSEKIIEEAEKEIAKQINSIKTRETVKESLENFAFILTKDTEESIKFANQYAAEHLEIMTENPEEVADEIKNSGAIFLGEHSPVAAGDYASGGNHVLPTGGTARFSSVLSVRDFLKTSSIQRITKRGLLALKETIETISNSEGFDAHRKSVEIRFNS